jgi:hypothetical protein
LSVDNSSNVQDALIRVVVDSNILFLSTRQCNVNKICSLRRENIDGWNEGILTIFWHKSICRTLGNSYLFGVLTEHLRPWMLSKWMSIEGIEKTAEVEASCAS